MARGSGGAMGAGSQATHRAKVRRRDGDIAPYRNGTRGGRTVTGHEGVHATGHGWGARRGGAGGGRGGGRGGAYGRGVRRG